MNITISAYDGSSYCKVCGEPMWCLHKDGCEVGELRKELYSKLQPSQPGLFHMQMLNEWIEPWWMEYNRIFILAHTEVQARRWANEQGMGKNSWSYLVDADRLRGHRQVLVVVLDGFAIGKSPRDLEEIFGVINMMKSLERLVIKYEQDMPKEPKDPG